MKLTILLILISLSSSVFASTLPKNWVVETNDKSLETISTETENYFNSILEVQSHALDQISATEEAQLIHPHYHLSYYVTDFSVTKSGLLGLSALKSNKGLEVKWGKKKQEKVAQEESENIIEIESGDEFSLREAQESIVSIAYKSGSIKNTENLRSDVEKTLKELDFVFHTIQNKNFTRWELNGFRVEIGISASGKVWTIANAGAGIRFRLEWKKSTKSNAVTQKAYSVSKASHFVNKVLYDLDSLLPNNSIGDFKVKKVNIGVGVNYKGGFLGLSSFKSSNVGFLSFKPLSKKEFNNAPVDLEEGVDTDDIEYEGEEVIDGNQKSLNIFRIPRNRFRDGIRKSVSMLTSFANQTNTKGINWEVRGLKGIYTVTQSGFLGLATVSSNGVLEIEISK